MAAIPDAPPAMVVPAPQRRAIVAGVMTGMALAALEATIVGTAMPTVVAALGGLAHFSWVFSAYLLTSTVSVPLWGKLSDLYGRRLFYQLGIAVFLIGSVLSGMSQSMPQLIAARALQGLGAGALIPLGMTIIGEIFTIRERARMQGLFSGVWGLSSIVGPLAGGFITDQLSWRWVFYINVPFGIVSAVIIGLALKEEKTTRRPKIDYLGAVVMTTAVTLLMLVLVEGESAAALLRPRNLALLGTVLLLLVWFVRIERTAAEPIVPLLLFRNRVISLAMIIGFLAGVAMFGAISFVPLFAQGARGATATAAGSFLTPLMLAWVTASIVGGRLLIRIGSRPVVIAGLAALVVGFAALTLATRTTPTLWLMVELIVIGVGLGFTMLTLLIAVQHAVPREQLGIATSLNQFFRSIGGAMGVALLGALMTAGLAANLREAAANPGSPLTPAQAEELAANPSALVSPEARRGIRPAALEILQESLGRSIRTVFAASGVLSAAALIFAFFLPRDRPVSVARRDEPIVEQDGEKFVMAEMAVLDPEHEPESG
ncbi:MAG TPA: MDR family MFS transporter [Thermoanaerobaculia bacterium]|nr:MDR family MFS transporter [Thermoanaerobaculia bacterium]